MFDGAEWLPMNKGCSISNILRNSGMVVNVALKAYDEFPSMTNSEQRTLYRPYDWNQEEGDKFKGK